MSLDPATTWLQAAAALAAVLLLIWGAARALRASPLAWAGPVGGPGGAGAARRRLGVQEVMALDGRRRLVLLRCDGRELLLLTAATSGPAEDRILGWLPPAPAPDREP